MKRKTVCGIFVFVVVGIIIFRVAKPWVPRQGSEELGNKGHLGELRSALSIYYGESGGKYPASLHDLIPKYETSIPMLIGLPHSSSNEIDGPSSPADTGHWMYNNE